MDVATLDQLAGERLPPPVVDALNRDTSSHLSVEEAHSEAAAIESYLRNSASGSPAAAEPVRAKIEADFQSQMARLQNVPGKGEFETEPDYRDRVNHAQEMIQATEQEYDTDIAWYYLPFASRIRILESASFPITDKCVFESYDADAQVMKGQVNGAEYIFSGVVPDLAKKYHDQWSTVQLGRSYDEDGTRFLFFTRTGPRLLGQPAQKVQDERAAGVWVDSQTGLMWTIRSSSSPMQLPDASNYCKTLPMAGFSDWMLPAIGQLDTLVTDPRRGGVKGGITIAAPGVRAVWSASLPSFDQQVQIQPVQTVEGDYVDAPVRYDGVWAFLIPAGQRAHTNAGLLLPMLCVRYADAGSPPPAAPVRFPRPPIALRQAEANFYGRRYTEAFPLADRACSAGLVRGCALEGYLIAFGLGHPADAARGIDMMTKACDSHDLAACDGLGVAYLRGGPVPVDQKRAFQLFTKSCIAGLNGSGGFPEGCVNVAECFLNGVGTRKDVADAWKFFDRSCTIGLDDFAGACHDGDAEGCKNLGRCYLRGNYLNKDLDTATMYFQRACSLGDQAVCAELGKLH